MAFWRSDVCLSVWLAGWLAGWLACIACWSTAKTLGMLALSGGPAANPARKVRLFCPVPGIGRLSSSVRLIAPNKPTGGVVRRCAKDARTGIGGWLAKWGQTLDGPPDGLTGWPTAVLSACMQSLPSGKKTCKPARAEVRSEHDGLQRKNT